MQSQKSQFTSDEVWLTLYSKRPRMERKWDLVEDMNATTVQLASEGFSREFLPAHQMLLKSADFWTWFELFTTAVFQTLLALSTRREGAGEACSSFIYFPLSSRSRDIQKIYRSHKSLIEFVIFTSLLEKVLPPFYLHAKQSDSQFHPPSIDSARKQWVGWAPNRLGRNHIKEVFFFSL